MPVIATFKTDWFRVITDITRCGVPIHEIARELDVSKSAVIGWKQGAEPGHSKGEALIEFWRSVTHLSRERLPVNIVSRRFVYGRK
ncbi:hypothetical protein B1H58_13255 [Pantoea alhagi]|uniref:Transcriptional regulator n=1 Tax=Pantoea alhagi TaxID=1891675 RepID=A0A1W6B726_9GAMM|nr:hypothetical protein B1H58_13255 [Pantoea alhagi]